jgi:site-specific recombinase XerD
MKKPVLIVRPYRHHLKFKFILDLRAYGKGRLFFKTRAEADDECLRQKTLLERHSRAAIGLSQREMSDVITARERLAGYGKNINDAVEFFVDHLDRVRRCKTTVAELVDEVIEAKRKDGKAPRYIESLRLYLSKFSRDFGSRSVAAITPEELDTWLRDLLYSPKSRANFRSHIGVLFSYAVNRRMIESNPILFTARPKLVDKPPDIFSPEELQSLLEAAQGVEPDVVRMLAIGAFAGLRDAEIKQLDFSEVDLARGFVEVKAAKAKSARRRLVPIQPNLMKWLNIQRTVRPVVLSSRAASWREFEKRRNRVETQCARHSFASYRLAVTNNAAQTALKSVTHQRPCCS